MRGADVLPTIRFYKQGYPISMYIAEFIRKFTVFLPTNLKTDDSNNTIKDHRQCVSEIMSKADLDESLFKIGINQVNLKYSYCLNIFLVLNFNHAFYLMIQLIS